MIVGTMDDISDEDQIALTQQQQQQQQQQSTTTDSNASVTHTESLNTVSTHDQSVLFQREARIKIDYKQMDTDFMNVTTKATFPIKK